MSRRILWTKYDEEREEHAQLVEGPPLGDAEGRPFLELTLDDNGTDVTVRLYNDDLGVLLAALAETTR